MKFRMGTFYKILLVGFAIVVFYVSNNYLTTNNPIAQDAILADALAIESGAKEYCMSTECVDGLEFTWNQLSSNIEGLNESYYDFTANNSIICVKDLDGFKVYLEASGRGEYEFEQGLVPSNNDRNSVKVDVN